MSGVIEPSHNRVFAVVIGAGTIGLVTAMAALAGGCSPVTGPRVHLDTDQRRLLRRQGGDRLWQGCGRRGGLLAVWTGAFTQLHAGLCTVVVQTVRLRFPAVSKSATPGYP